MALAAGFDDKEDPSKLYRFNVFEGSLEGLDRILFESYVEVVNRIQRIDNAVNFCVAFPETSRALNFIDGEADSIAGKIFKLYKQHADEVGEALDAQGRQSFPRLRRSELPVDCLLSIAAAGLRQIPGASSGQSKPGDKKTEPTGANGQNEPLVIDETTFKITWQGQHDQDTITAKAFGGASDLTWTVHYTQMSSTISYQTNDPHSTYPNYAAEYYVRACSAAELPHEAGQ